MRKGEPPDPNCAKPTSTGQHPRTMPTQTCHDCTLRKPPKCSMIQNHSPTIRNQYMKKLALTNMLNAMTKHDGTDISMVPQDQYFHDPMMQTLERQQKGIISLFVKQFMEMSICKTSSQPTKLPRGYHHQHGHHCTHHGYHHLTHMGRTVHITAAGVP